jgi:FkbM family methyltransferase
MKKMRFLHRFILWKFYKFLGIKLLKVNAMGAQFFVDTEIPGISDTLFVRRTRETDMLKIINDHVQPNDVILDCGSNIGVYPILESNLLNSGRIICVEPDMRNWEALEKNIQQINKKIKVNIFKGAISNKNSDSELDVSGPSNLSKLSSNITNGQTVRCITIPELCKQYNFIPNFIRMDIEGHEVEVLEGMISMLPNMGKLSIIFETHSVYYNKLKFKSILNEYFKNGFKSKILVSAGEIRPPLFIELGLEPDYHIVSDNITRGFYLNVADDFAIELVTAIPKATRYMFLSNVP